MNSNAYQYLNLAFAQGRRFAPAPGREFVLRCESVGHLVAVSGEIVVCDPLCALHNTPPLAQRIPPGRHPVVLSFAERPGDERVAFAKLVLRDEPPAEWKMALRAGEDESALREGESFGFGVDSGNACFVDGRVAREVSRFHNYAERFDPRGNHWEEILPTLQANLIGFSTGYGDGVYTAYWGLDTRSQPICLVVDFEAADLTVREEVRDEIVVCDVGRVRKGTCLEGDPLKKLGLTLTIVDSMRHSREERKKVLAFVISGDCRPTVLDGLQISLTDPVGAPIQHTLDEQHDRAVMGVRRVYTLMLEQTVPEDAVLKCSLRLSLKKKDREER